MLSALSPHGLQVGMKHFATLQLLSQCALCDMTSAADRMTMIVVVIATSHEELLVGAGKHDCSCFLWCHPHCGDTRASLLLPLLHCRCRRCTCMQACTPSLSMC
jgi:hypothetical protein